jgi:hypothetical protein
MATSDLTFTPEEQRAIARALTVFIQDCLHTRKTTPLAAETALRKLAGELGAPVPASAPVTELLLETWDDETSFRLETGFGIREESWFRQGNR